MSLNGLIQDLRTQRIKVRAAEARYGAKPTQRALSVLLPPELRYLAEMVALAEVVTQAFEERIEVKDVHAPGFDDLTAKLRSWWKLNDGDEKNTLVVNEALITGRGYVSVALDENDEPLMAVESAHDVIHKADRRTGAIIEGARLYKDDDDVEHAVWYTPEDTQYFVMGTLGRWRPEELPGAPRGVLRHGLGRPTVEPFVNRGRIRNVWGTPEARKVWDLQDDISRTMVDLAGASALMGTPTRAIFGVDDSETKDENGNEVPAAELYMARLLTFADSAGKIAEFSAAQLSQFTSAMTFYIREASMLSGVPVSYFAVASEANPASGDSQRADEDRLVTRAKRIARGFRRPWRNVHQIEAQLKGEKRKEALNAIEVDFVNPATITPGARADYATKVSSIKVSKDQLVGPDFLLDVLGMTPDQIAARIGEMEIDQLTNVLNQIDASGGAGGNAEAEPAASGA